MLYTDEERAIMADAIHANMRLSSPAVQKSIRSIFDAFVGDRDLRGAKILDIGPGQCDLLDILRERGAETYGIDYDPAVVKLGEMRGHNMRLHNLSKGWPLIGEKFDGMFCRASINCFWFASPEGPAQLRAFLDALLASLQPQGWMWILPWNKPSEKHQGLEDTVRATIGEWAKQSKVTIEVAGKAEKHRYQLSYTLPYIEFWTRNCESSTERDPARKDRWSPPLQPTAVSNPSGAYAAYEACRKRILAGASARDEAGAAAQIFECAQEFLESPSAESGDAYAAFIAARPKPDVLYSFFCSRLRGMTQGRLDKAPGTKGRVYAWGWAYWARGAIYAGLATGEQRFADLVLDAYERLLNERDDSLEMQDETRQRIVKSWGVQTPESPLRACEVTATGLLLLPICDLLLSPLADGLSPAHRQLLTRSITDGLDEFDSELVDDAASGGAYFRSPFDQAVEALNHTHVFAACLAKAHQLTGNEKYRRDAERIARYFLAACVLEDNGTYSWAYAPSPGNMRHMHPPMSIALNNVKNGVGGEAFYKASVTTEFAVAAHRANIGLNQTDMQRIADAFLKNVLRPNDGLNLYVSSRKDRPAEEFAQKYAAQFMLVSGFGLLDGVRPEIRERMVRLFGRRPDLFPNGWFGGPSGSMIMAYFMSRTERRLDE